MKEAIEKIVSMAGIQVVEGAGRPYRNDTMAALPRPLNQPVTVNMHTLSGLCDYLTHDIDHDVAKMGVLVGSHEHAMVVTDTIGDFNQRFFMADAKPYVGRQFKFGQYVDPEQFIVDVQSCFVQDDTTAALLKIIGNLQSEQVATVVDDGVSQQVTAKAGVARVSNVVLPNPVVLRPFSSFQEIEQPARRFVLRVRRGASLPEIALFESSDEQWKLAAVKSIKEYITANAPGVLVLA